MHPRSYPSRTARPRANPEPAAVAPRSPYCLANSPGRPSPHRGRTSSPIRAPVPRKSVTFPRHPCPGADPHTPCARSTSSPRLRYFFPPIRLDPAISTPVLKHTHIRATLAQARDRPRSPRTLPPTGKDRRGIPCGCPASLLVARRQRRHGRSARLPSVLFCHAVRHLCPELPTPALQNFTGSPAVPATKRTKCRRI